MTIPWSYDPNSAAGPADWPRLFNQTAGQRQSPINILTSDLYEQHSKLTCCRGITSHIKSTGGALDDNANELSAHMDAHLHLGQTLHRRHLDSVGEEARATSPDSGRRSGSLSGSDRSNSNSPAAPNDDASSLEKHSSASDQKTRYCVTKRKLFLGFPRFLGRVRLENNGHAWQANIPPEIGQHTLLSGPPFGDRHYRLAQFHCHWGRDCNSGSEHTINGVSYAAELHFVHWNCSQFSSFEEASRHAHGLAVLGVLVQALEGDQNRNRHLERVSAHLRNIREPKSSVDVSLGLDLKRLFPANRWQYATYEGSLTTPPLSETVDWLVFLNPIQCSTSQLEQFRRIECAESGPMFDNCRPVQATNGRLVSIWSHH